MLAPFSAGDPGAVAGDAAATAAATVDAAAVCDAHERRHGKGAQSAGAAGEHQGQDGWARGRARERRVSTDLPGKMI